MIKEYYSAYYYTLDKTGDPLIDKILEAVAYAGKAEHHTMYWNDENSDGNPSLVDRIQQAANQAAKSRGNAYSVNKDGSLGENFDK